MVIVKCGFIFGVIVLMLIGVIVIGVGIYFFF